MKINHEVIWAGLFDQIYLFCEGFDAGYVEVAGQVNKNDLTITMAVDTEAVVQSLTPLLLASR